MSSHSALKKTTQSDFFRLPRDRPWLLPSNRKLRHLQGISLRNLTLVRPSSRPRGKTIDDESLPTAFKTQAKLFAQQEDHKLEHSRSSNDLKSPSKNKTQLGKEDSDTDGATKLRPSALKLRRRSTLNWTNASPRIRQIKLEDATKGRMADTWFSLHCSDIPEPVYVSEVVDKAMNPSFRYFDLNTYGPSVTRRDELVLKFWAKTANMDDYILLIELKVHLGSLQYIGKTLENFYHPFPKNCIIFHLSDGMYTSFTDLPLDDAAAEFSRTLRLQSSEPQCTSSFETLMRLSNLDDCIQDALATREKLTMRINELLEKHRKELEIIDAASQAQESLVSTNHSLSSARKALKSAEARRSELQASLEARRMVITSGKLSQEKTQSYLASAEITLSARAQLRGSIKTSISSQIRRICEDLLHVYPIEPVPDKHLLFTIRDLPVPNANSLAISSDANPASTAAGFAYVAHIVYLLSLYLSIPIPYPPKPHGSTSSIQDPISTSLHSLSARTFPLYQKGAVSYRFEYAIFLLNSDIELLMSKQGLRMVDQRHTLPNLKYLLYVLTAGKGELPVRDKGDVKALKRSGQIGDIKQSYQLNPGNGNGSVTKEKQIRPGRRPVLDDED